MPYPYFASSTLDDVLRDVITELLSVGHRINPGKGPALELTGALLEIGDPRARISRTETRGRLFSGLGELCWYLAKTDDLDFISYYIPHYKYSSEQGLVFGGYGPRIFNNNGHDQIDKVISMLSTKTDTRRAVVQIFDSSDTIANHADVPCTCLMQFMIRKGVLHMITYMRSNDVYVGIPHDVFSFTMLHEIVARSLSIDIGSYKHVVGSLHLYDTNQKQALTFLNEGWQSTQRPMPRMPQGDPWPSIERLLEAESKIRTQGAFAINEHDAVDPYWADLIRLLQVYRCGKDGDRDGIITLRAKLSSDVYLPFVDRKLTSLG